MLLVNIILEIQNTSASQNLEMLLHQSRRKMMANILVTSETRRGSKEETSNPVFQAHRKCMSGHFIPELMLDPRVTPSPSAEAECLLPHQMEIARNI